MPPKIPCIIFEDEHLLAVNKPAGINTHAPSPYAGEGIYDWLRNREPRWAKLAIIHRLDKETSGVIVFGKTPLANRSLTEQFTHREVRKKYVLLTDRPVPREEFTVKTTLVRAGEKYLARPLHAGAEVAETRFKLLPSDTIRTPDRVTLEAEPLTGRTHQIRVHAAHEGFPILGDILYGGTPGPRVFLHAQELRFRHPASGEQLTFSAELDFRAEVRRALRDALIDPEATNAWRLIHGASDNRRGWYVDRLGDFLLSQGAESPDASQLKELEDLMKSLSVSGVYHKTLARQVRGPKQPSRSSRHLIGIGAPEHFTIRENGVRFEMSFEEGYSVGLFLDQRDNRRRLLSCHIAAGFSLADFPTENPNGKRSVLNAFAYTCGFSVCAARAGARTTSLDLSKKYLEWGKRNFRLNELDPEEHSFIYGDALDWLNRFYKKQSRFDLILLDPPTFSQSKEHGVFRVEKDYGKLVSAAVRLLGPGGVLFASTNAAEWAPDEFVAEVEAAIHATKRRILQRHYVPQPPDFPMSRAEPGYLKTIWLRVE